MSFRGLLRRAFSSAANPNSKESIEAICAQLKQERDLTRLVNMFKISSELPHFRKHLTAYGNTIRRLTQDKQFKAIQEILEHQKKYPESSSESFVVRLICLYGIAGMFDNAQKLFDEMPLRNVPRTVLSLNALLTACVKSKRLDMVDKIFRELPNKLSIEPNLVTYNIMIKAFLQKGSIDSVVLLIAEMEKKGANPNLISYNTILDWFYRKGRFEQAEKIWGLMVEKNIVPDIWSYNAKLLGLVHGKRTEEGVQLVEDLRKIGLKPDVFSFGALIIGFVKEGNLDEAKRWYGQVVESGVPPTKLIFETLIPFACEKGDREYAFELGKDVLKSGSFVGVRVLQNVVFSLAKASKMEEAEEIVKLGRTNNYRFYNLKLPSEE